MERLNVAIVGCGDISGRHIDAYRNFADRARIAACCDTDAERAHKAAEKTGDPETHAVTDFAEILANPTISAVNLALPHHLHAPMTIAAARAGKHILCEKPLALSAEECDAMIAACREAGVILMHGEPLRMAANAERAAELMQEGKIGALVGLQGTFAYWQRAELNREWRGRRSEAGGGHLMDGGIHLVDVFRHVGGDVTSVQAMTAEWRPELGEGEEDIALVNMRFANGALGQLFACHATKGGRGASPTMTIFGLEGCLSLDAYADGGSLVLFRPGEAPQKIETDSSWHQGYDGLMRHFLDVIQNGVPLRATPEDGRENVRLVLAAYESARTGREVRL